MKAQTDQRLAKRAARADERAFASIFQRYNQEIYRFCLSILGNVEDAREALQSTMVKALQALPGEEREIKLRPWLYRVAHNQSIDLLRRRREVATIDPDLAAPGDGLAETAAQRANACASCCGTSATCRSVSAPRC
jgi:RNA polymerase sigma factor (sigma-70 family)